MAKSIVVCSDDAGERLEAHCEQWEGEPLNRFSVDVVSEKGLRGHFVMDVPHGVPFGTALNVRIHEEWIHARN